jgi:hypothetical protein
MDGCNLEGLPSTCYTDNKPLTQLQSQTTISRRQARWLELLASFQPNVVYVQGKYNPADVLSRPPQVLTRALPDLGRGPEHPLPGCLASILRGSALLNRRMSPPHTCASLKGSTTTILPEGVAGAPRSKGPRDPQNICAGVLGEQDHTLNTERSRTTREPTKALLFALISGASPKLHPYVSPQLTGAEARDWWMAAYATDPDFSTQCKTAHVEKYQLTQTEGLWYFKHKLLVVPTLLRQKVLEQCHDTLTSAHFGITKTLHNLQRSFWWPGYRADVKLYLQYCLSCARNKPINQKPQGFLSPPCRCLPVHGSQYQWTLSPISQKHQKAMTPFWS